MRFPRLVAIKLLLVLVINAAQTSPLVLAADTRFTYYGQSSDSALQTDGQYDMIFKLYDKETGGSQVTAPYPTSAVSVRSGAFSVPIDFGSTVFEGLPRWIEIQVRPSNTSSAYSTLHKRIAIVGAQYSQFSRGLSTEDTIDGFDVCVEGPLRATSGPVLINNGLTVSGPLTANNGMTVSGGSLRADNDVIVLGPLQAGSGIAVSGQLDIDGGVNVSSGTLIAEDGLTVSGLLSAHDLSITGELSAPNTRPVHVTDDMFVSGLLTADSGLTVSWGELSVRDVSMTGKLRAPDSPPVQVDDDMVVSGLLRAESGMTVSWGMLNANEGITVSGLLSAGDMSVTGKIVTPGETSVRVDDDMTVQGRLMVDHDMQVRGPLTVDDAMNVLKTLTAVGDMTVSGLLSAADISVTGEIVTPGETPVRVDDDMHVLKTLTAAGDMAVLGPLTAKAGITVSGSLNADDMNISRSMTLGGTLKATTGPIEIAGSLQLTGVPENTNEPAALIFSDQTRQVTALQNIYRNSLDLKVEHEKTITKVLSCPEGYFVLGGGCLPKQLLTTPMTPAPPAVLHFNGPTGNWDGWKVIIHNGTLRDMEFTVFVIAAKFGNTPNNE